MLGGGRYDGEGLNLEALIEQAYDPFTYGIMKVEISHEFKVSAIRAHIETDSSQIKL